MSLLQRYNKQERNVSFYAKQLNITPKYLSSVVKEVSGKTAARWIDESVILEAKTLLKYSGMSIQEIAYHLNFSTQSFFGKYFKQHTGTSPSRYKRKGECCRTVIRQRGPHPFGCGPRCFSVFRCAICASRRLWPLRPCPTR